MRLSKSGNQILGILPNMASRHGLITGATGSGKTVSIKVLAEAFSEMGVPVFMQDVKGDLTGFVTPGEGSEKFLKHIAKFNGEEPEYKSFPTVFWDIFGEEGHPLRTTISEMGPMMMSRLLKLNDTQTGVVYTVFRIADDQGWLLLDFKDFMSVIDHVALERKNYQQKYGSIAPQSIGAIKRKLLMLESDGLGKLFGEPALDIKDIMKTDANGKGIINVLNAQQISQSPSTYASFLLWLLSELFEELDEVGDQILPRLVFFFEESHLIFQNASKLLLEKIEQLVKLIRSKGVGVFFITQNPRDIPDNVLAQLGSKIQHALRAFTPAEQKVIRSVAKSFRNETDMDIAEEIMSLKTGEALISVIQEDGSPSPVEKAYIFAPESSMGKADDSLIESEIRNSFLYSKYEKTFDSVSAYEILQERAKAKIAKVEENTPEEKKDSVFSSLLKGSGRGDSPVQRMVKSAMGSIGTQVGRSIMRGLFGSFKR